MSQWKSWSDEELARRAQEGDDAAFAELVDRYTPVIYRVARGMTGSGQDAEDIVQETFLRAYTHLEGYAPSQSAFRTWLLTIARNLAINLIHALKRRAARFLDDVGSVLDTDRSSSEPSFLRETDTDAESFMIRQEQMQRLERVLNKLPQRQRAVLVLKAYEGLGYAEIAKIMGTSESSVESLIFRARKKLVELLGKES